MSKATPTQRIECLTIWMKTTIKRKSIETRTFLDPLMRKGIRDKPKEVFSINTSVPVEEKSDGEKLYV